MMKTTETPYAESPWAGTDVSVVPTSLLPERENDKLLTTIAEVTVKVKKVSYFCKLWTSLAIIDNGEGKSWCKALLKYSAESLNSVRKF